MKYNLPYLAAIFHDYILQDEGGMAPLRTPPPPRIA